MTLELLKSLTGRTLIESHRGMEGDVAENSWPAIQLGHQLGADLIEVDVQLSCDGVAFLRHNYQLPDGYWCHELPWKELEQFRIEGESFPRLEEVLDWAGNTNAHLSLDLKTFFKPEGSLAKEVMRLVERTNTKDNVLLLFYDHEELFQTKRSHPDVAVRALITGRLSDFAGYLKKIGADCVSLSYGILRLTDIEKIHATGTAVALVEYWNRGSDLFRQFEIDILSCGNPETARKILSRP